MQAFCGGGAFYPMNFAVSRSAKVALDRPLDFPRFDNMAFGFVGAAECCVSQKGIFEAEMGSWSRLLRNPSSWHPHGAPASQDARRAISPTFSHLDDQMSWSLSMRTSLEDRLFSLAIATLFWSKYGRYQLSRSRRQN